MRRDLCSLGLLFRWFLCPQLDQLGLDWALAQHLLHNVSRIWVKIVFDDEHTSSLFIVSRE